MSVVDCSKIPCKYSNKDCPFGKVCKYLHSWGKVSARSKPAKATSKVKEHVKDVITKNPHLLVAKDKHVALGLAKQAKDLIQRRSTVLAAKADFEKKYVLVGAADSKSMGATTPFDDSLKLIESEMKAMRSMAQMSFGQRPVTIPLIVVLTVSNTAANTNATFLTLDPSNSIDWPAIATIFDEVKTTHVLAEYFPRSFATAPIGAVAGNESAEVFVYDPEDLVPLTGLPQGCSYAYHKKYMLAQALATGAAGTALNSVHRLSIPIPKGDLITPPANTATSLCVGDAWVDTTGGAGTCDPVGTLKWYEKNGMNTALAVGTVVETFTCHFRMRF